MWIVICCDRTGDVRTDGEPCHAIPHNIFTTREAALDVAARVTLKTVLLQEWFDLKDENKGKGWHDPLPDGISACKRNHGLAALDDRFAAKDEIADLAASLLETTQKEDEARIADETKARESLRAHRLERIRKGL